MPLLFVPLLLLAGQLPAVGSDPVEQVQNPWLALREIFSEFRTGAVPQDRPPLVLGARVQGDCELRVLPY